MSEQTPKSNPPQPRIRPYWGNRDASQRFPARYSRHFNELDDVRTITVIDSTSRLERPTDKVIEALRQDDSRIDAVHIQEEGFEQALERRLASDFSDKPMVLIRAIQASIDGLVTDGIVDVHDVRDILWEGDILRRSRINLTEFRPGITSFISDPAAHLVLSFVMDTGSFRELAVGDVEGADRIFPALLVYEHLGIKYSDLGTGYTYDLTMKTDQRKDIIRRAYILDALIK